MPAIPLVQGKLSCFSASYCTTVHLKHKQSERNPSGRRASVEAALPVAEGSSVHTGQEAAGPALPSCKYHKWPVLMLALFQDGILEVKLMSVKAEALVTWVYCGRVCSPATEVLGLPVETHMASAGVIKPWYVKLMLPAKEP